MFTAFSMASGTGIEGYIEMISKLHKTSPEGKSEISDIALTNSMLSAKWAGTVDKKGVKILVSNQAIFLVGPLEFETIGLIFSVGPGL